MEKHNCKLCSRSFSSGRALGGHMRSHLATFPLPPVKTLLPPPSVTVSTTSGECCSGEFSTNEEDQKKGLYGLRRNPKKSLRSPGESETESARKTGRRSKRSRRSAAAMSTDQSVVSSVTDNSTEEDLAMCLMMLSRDVWNSNGGGEDSKKKKQRKKKKVKVEEDEEQDINGGDYEEVARNVVVDKKVHECPFCGKVFGSGQALGGHKRSHPSAVKTTTTVSTTVAAANKVFYIDLNLPAPAEEEEIQGVQVMQEVCVV